MRIPLQTLFSHYESLVVLDTETSGLRADVEEIIELSAVRVSLVDGAPEIVEEYDQLISLSPGKRLDYRITQLTGIDEKMLADDGISKARACADLAALLSHGKTLIVAYNAQFDLCFLYYFLLSDGDVSILRAPDALDAMSVYKDRRDYPHKLKDAIDAYDLRGKVINSHRALDDVKATFEVLKAMDMECPDLEHYINLFGYNPKYGTVSKRIKSIRYEPQPYQRTKKLYE